MRCRLGSVRTYYQGTPAYPPTQLSLAAGCRHYNGQFGPWSRGKKEEEEEEEEEEKKKKKKIL